MNLDLTDLLWLTLICLVLLIWWQGLKVRERALACVRQRCQELDLQMLDQSVALTRIRLRRNTGGTLSVCRVFRFEFSSTGEERYSGEVTMLGLRLQDLTIEPHRI